MCQDVTSTRTPRTRNNDRRRQSSPSPSRNHKLAAQSRCCQQMCFFWLENGFDVFLKHVASILKLRFHMKFWILASPENYQKMLPLGLCPHIIRVSWVFWLLSALDRTCGPPEDGAVRCSTTELYPHTTRGSVHLTAACPVISSLWVTAPGLLTDEDGSDPGALENV